MSANGTALERALGAYHDQLRARGLALVMKVPTPVQIKGRRGAEIVGVRQPPVWVDYAGVIAGGRAVAIEAKVRKDRVRLSDLEPHQRQTLADVDALGGVAIVYAALADGSELVIPWGDLLLQTSIHAGHGLWTRPRGRGWYDAARWWAAYEEGGWAAVPVEEP